MIALGAGEIMVQWLRTLATPLQELSSLWAAYNYLYLPTPENLMPFSGVCGEQPQTQRIDNE